LLVESETDSELASLALAGDVQALALLLERCRPSLYSTAVGLLGNRADALDAVQDTCLVALVRLNELRDTTAARAWLHAVVRNVCLMRIRQRREHPSDTVEVADTVPGPEQALDEHAMREWVWQALEALPPDERLTVMLRYFTRCQTYEEIAHIAAVPIGTVRSRLNRARARLETNSDVSTHRADVEARRRAQWEGFYGELHEHPAPRTYQDLFAPDVEVRDRSGHWLGVERWSAHEREAIGVGVRATIVGLLASRDVTVLEIDFTNPEIAPRHCPPQATFVHRLDDGRSRSLRIHYPIDRVSADAS
jgi:RNA polymerase sigma-70 factor (ECF subfamily)